MTDRRPFPLGIFSQDGEFILCGGRHASRSRPASALPLAPLSRKPSVVRPTKLDCEHSLTNELESAWATHPLAVTTHLGQAAVALAGFGGAPCRATPQRAFGAHIVSAQHLWIDCLRGLFGPGRLPDFVDQFPSSGRPQQGSCCKPGAPRSGDFQANRRHCRLRNRNATRGTNRDL